VNPHVDVGAYLLGVLDDDEMARFEAHLVDCELCGDELDQLSGVVPVLDELRADGLGFAELPGGDAMLDRLLARVAGERRAHRRRRLVAIAAAAVLVVGGPTVAVLAVQDNGDSHPAVQGLGSDRHTASNPATGVSAVVAVTGKGWGTAVDLRLTGVHGPLTCSLVAFGGNGKGQTVATWSVPSEGYGTDAQPSPLTVHGAAGLHPADITHFDVRTDTGALLVTVPARS
jgi:hypothetical protein